VSFFRLGKAAMRNLSQDIRYALRQLRRSPGYVATVVLAVTMAIGANVIVFGVSGSITVLIDGFLHLLFVPLYGATEAFFKTDQWFIAKGFACRADVGQ